MNRIGEMMQLQASLNERIAGKNWRSGHTEEGRAILWYRCIYMETAEAIESLNWKHWKGLNAPPDWQNIRVELIDIWHFVMSEAIRLGNDYYAVERYNDAIDALKTPDSDRVIVSLERILFLSAEAVVNDKNPIREVTDLFFNALASSGMSVIDLYKHYVAKNQLNIFRQNNGYKENTYTKIWDAIEDNVIAFHILEENPSLTPDEFYKKLEEEYNQMAR